MFVSLIRTNTNLVAKYTSLFLRIWLLKKVVSTRKKI